jgi:Flp pilus assembly pilin Flp
MSLNKKRRLVDETEGATAIEYAFIAAGVALAIAVVVFTMGDELVPIFTTLTDSFSRS